MVLQDHFQPPFCGRRHWHTFHNARATYIAADLNSRLPEGFFAEPNVRFGVEVDVAALDESGARGQPDWYTASSSWQPRADRTVTLAILEDDVEVQVFSAGGICLPVDLAASHSRTCRDLRVGDLSAA